RVQNWRISGVPVYFRPETSISGKQSATASPDDGVNVRITGEQMPRRLERIPIAVVDHDGLRLSTVEPLGQRVRPEADEQRHVDHAGTPGGQCGDVGLDALRQQRGEPIAPPDTCR